MTFHDGSKDIRLSTVCKDTCSAKMMSICRRRATVLSGAAFRVKFKPSCISHTLVQNLALSSISSNDDKKATIETNQDRRDTDVRILRELGKHLWPDPSHPNSFTLKSRVVAAVSLLVASKVINIQVPFLFKALVDSFQVDHTMLVNSVGDPLLLATPIAVVLGYGIARASSSLAAECRSAIFAPVAHDAIRQGEENNR